jgi:hypothetical protein
VGRPGVQAITPESAIMMPESAITMPGIADHHAGTSDHDGLEWAITFDWNARSQWAGLRRCQRRHPYGLRMSAMRGAFPIDGPGPRSDESQKFRRDGRCESHDLGRRTSKRKTVGPGERQSE